MDATTGLQGPEQPKIVIVEDDPGVRRSMQLLFKGNGCDVRAYPSGDALLVSDDAVGPDCLVIDFLLDGADGADGIDLLTALRKRGWAGPAVLVTGFPSADVARRAQEAGFASVFEKPLKERSLVEAVSRLARLARGG
jgi:FixJ family two-component response regulator